MRNAHLRKRPSGIVRFLNVLIVVTALAAVISLIRLVGEFRSAFDRDRYSDIEYYLQQGEYEKITLSFDEVLIDSCRKSAEQIAEEDPVTKFCVKLTGLLDSGRCYVENKNDFGGAAQKGFIGLEDTDCYYLLADAVHAEVKRQCAEQDEHFSITKKDLLKQLADEQILMKSGERNTTTIRSGSGKLMSVIVLDKRKISQQMSRDLCPPSPSVESLPEPQQQNAAQGIVAQM